jgi:predicted metal-binding membrane protein
MLALGFAAAVAWLVAIAAELTGTGPLLHHHVLVEGAPLGGPPLWLAALLALASWQVMVAGMMVPASMPAIGGFERAARRFARPNLALVGFIGAFVVAWSIVGLVGFFGDLALQRVVAATPWLEEHVWTVQVGMFALAGLYQLTPLKHRFLDACRHPMASRMADSDGLVGVRAGWMHALDCIGASGPLMLLMFAAGFANLAWMGALTVVMAYEARGTYGHVAATWVGLGLLALAPSALLATGLAAWGSA